MIHSSICAMVLLAALACSLSTAQAANFRWLDASAARHLGERDWELLGDTARLALETGRDGQRFGWKNPGSGSEGSVEPLPATGRDASGDCRRLRIITSAGKETGTGIHTFCRQPGGEWKIAR